MNQLLIISFIAFFIGSNLNGQNPIEVSNVSALESDNIEYRETVLQPQSLISFFPTEKQQELEGLIDFTASSVLPLTNEHLNPEEDVYYWVVKAKGGELDKLPSVKFIGNEGQFDELVYEIQFIEAKTEANGLEKSVANGSQCMSGATDAALDLLLSMQDLFVLTRPTAVMFDWNARSYLHSRKSKERDGSWDEKVEDSIKRVDSFFYKMNFASKIQHDKTRKLLGGDQKSLFDAEENEKTYRKNELIAQLTEKSPDLVKELPIKLRKLQELDYKLLSENVIHGYWNNECETVAEMNDFSMAGMQFPTITKPLLDSEVNFRVGGKLAFETAAILLTSTKAANLAKMATKADKVLDVTEVARLDEAKIFSKSSRVIQMSSRNKASQKAGSKFINETLAKESQHFSALIDPRKLSTLTSDRAGNSRFKKVMAYIYEMETKAGIPPKQTIQILYKHVNVEPYSNARHVFAPKTEMLNLEAQYKLGKKWGLYSKENVELLKVGRAAKITTGTFKGEIVHIDHLLPKAKCPELENSMANLTWLPASENIRKSDKVTDAALRREKALNAEVGWQWQGKE